MKIKGIIITSTLASIALLTWMINLIFIEKDNPIEELVTHEVASSIEQVNKQAEWEKSVLVTAPVVRKPASVPSDSKIKVNSKTHARLFDDETTDDINEIQKKLEHFGYTEKQLRNKFNDLLKAHPNGDFSPEQLLEVMPEEVRADFLASIQRMQEKISNQIPEHMGDHQAAMFRLSESGESAKSDLTADEAIEKVRQEGFDPETQEVVAHPLTGELQIVAKGEASKLVEINKEDIKEEYDEENE